MTDYYGVQNNKIKSVREYLGFEYVALTYSAENVLRRYIDAIAKSDMPHAIPESEKFGTINHSAFDGIAYLRVPEHITEIGGCAFAKNKDLEHVIFDGPVRFGQDCFNGCGVRKIQADRAVGAGDYCFWHCNELEKLILPGLLRSGTRSVARCAKLRRAEFPNLVDFGKMIYDCPNLEFANLGGDSYSYAYESRFNFTTIQLCPKLKEVVLSPHPGRWRGNPVHYQNTNIGSRYQEVWGKNMAPDIRISFGAGNNSNLEKFEEFKNRDGQAVSAQATQPAGQQIKFYAIENINGWSAVCNDKGTYEKLLQIALNKGTLPAGNIETEISEFPGLVSIILPYSIKEIPYFGFVQCYDLESVTGKGVRKFGDHAFYCDDKVQLVDAPKATLADKDAFNGCGASVVCTFNVPKLKEIRGRAFWQTGAKELNLPNLKVAAQNAIEENSNLESLNISGMRRIGFLTVCDNPKLKQIAKHPKLVQNEFAFYGNGR